MRAKLGKDGALCFWCPGCNHLHRCPVSGSKAWGFNGDLEKPTLNPSVLVTWKSGDPDYPDQRCHSFVRDGRIQFLSDCTHEHAGNTLDIPSGRRTSIYEDYFRCANTLLLRSGERV
jgi:hypothetical protein